MSDLINVSPHWLLEVLYNANKTDIETFRVFKTYQRYFTDTRDFIGVFEPANSKTLRFKPLTDLADDCLFSVTFFKKFIKKRQTRRGAPGVKFYANAGKRAFASTGYPMIAKNWEFWTSYVYTQVEFTK
tara:strand:+ start:1073 stop:1459 length:387 start_codon:yes stop_codon:yes gene_type:complete